MTEKKSEENYCMSQQNHKEDNCVSDDSGEDETLSLHWQLEADYISKDCKQEMESPPKDCKQDTEGPPKDCKLEEVKRKDCKYEDNGIEQYYEEELIKDMKIEVVSDDWEEETCFWGEHGRTVFVEENPYDLSTDVSNERVTAKRCLRAFYPHCKKDVIVSQDYQPPIVPGERANKSSSQTMLNRHVHNGTATLTNSAKNCVITLPAGQLELMSQLSSPAAQECVYMGQQQKNINTARKTTSDIQTLQNFMREINENRKIEEVPHTELDTLLSKFILLVKRKDGNEYEPHTLRCMVGSIDRYLKEHSYNHTIIYGNSKDFPLTKQSLNAKIKFLKKIAESNPPVRQEGLTDDDIENLFKAGTLSLDNPTSLLNLVFFNNGIHFALRTKEQYSLQWGDIKLKIDPKGNQYLEYSDRQTKMLENCKNVRQMKPRIYATPHVPDRDPVTVYLKYQSFRPSAMIAPDSPFYLAPNVNYNPAFSEWYRSTKIGIQKIRAMMTTMKIRASLPESKRKVSYITKRRLVERLPQHRLAASGAMMPTTQQNSLHSFTNKSTVMEIKQRKAAINDLHTTLGHPSPERLPATSSVQPHPSTSRCGELSIHKRSFLSTQFAQPRNSNMYLNNYCYLTSEAPAKRHKPIYDLKK
ncbi:DNA-binding transcription factor activity, partial [Pristimantis euphronides]